MDAGCMVFVPCSPFFRLRLQYKPVEAFFSPRQTDSPLHGKKRSLPLFLPIVRHNPTKHDSHSVVSSEFPKIPYPFSVDSNEKQNTFVRIERKKAVPDDKERPCV